MRLGSIDIGSNAVRLLISETGNESTRPKKLKLVRIPVRLGFDTFTRKVISEKRLTNLLKTIKVFQLVMEIYEVEDYRACATSALRDATNSREVIEKIYDQTGILIDIISGKEEADIIYNTHIAEILDPDKSYFYIDVGGGSTEITVFAEKEKKAVHSFNIGTIRLLENNVSEQDWAYMQDWIKHQNLRYNKLIGIGSGGNINSMFQISRRKPGKPLNYDYIREFCYQISEYSVEERMNTYNIKPDRADVIIPACQIFLNVMKWAKIQQIYVPQIGLVDGIIQMLAEKHLSANH